MPPSANYPTSFSDASQAINSILSSENPYTILNINPEATKTQIIHAYKKLMLIYHPDKHVDINVKKSANLVAQKLNTAKSEAIDNLKHAENKSADTDVDRLALFASRILSQLIKGIFARDRTFVDVCRRTESYAFGIAMLWARSVLTKQQDVALKRIQAALANKATELNMLNLAQGVLPYLKNNKTIDKIRTRCHLDLLHADSPMTEFNLFSDENMGWNLEITQCLLLAQEIAGTYPGIPVIMHNLAFKRPKNHTFIGLYYEEGQYYLFNPNHIQFDSQQQGLQPLSWEEASQRIVSALYHVKDTIASSDNLSIPVSLFTLRPRPLAINFPDTHYSAKVPSISEKYLMQWFNEGAFGAEKVLQSIYDGELTNILSRFYENKPALFSTGLLSEYLMHALINEHIIFALEICRLDKISAQTTWTWSRKYINQYIKQGHSLTQLAASLPLFEKAGIDLIALIEPEVKINGSPWLDDIDKKITTIEILRQIMQLQVRLTEKQRIILVARLSDEIYSLAIEIASENLFRSREHVIEKQNKYSESIEKINKKIAAKITWLQTLIDFGYHFKMPDGLKESSYLYLALVEAELSDLAHQYAVANLINLDAKNTHDETVLNHLTGKMNWVEIRYLIDRSAQYSVGPKIKANMIPSFAAWIHHVDFMRDVYEEPGRKQLLAITFQEGDLLAAATCYSAMPIMEYALANGFDEKLSDHPVLYLYNAKNSETVNYLLKFLPKQYLNQEVHLIRTMPYTIDSIMGVTHITPLPHTSEKLLPSLLGVSKENMDATVAQLGTAKLVKIVLDQSTVYYSADDELTKKLCLYFAPNFIEQCYQAVRQTIFQTANHRVPDLAYCINQLSSLFDIANECKSPCSFQTDYTRYQMHHHAFAEKSHQNQWESLVTQGLPLLGLKITYDVNDTAIGFTWINDIQLSGMEAFIGTQKSYFAHNLNEQIISLWSCIDNLYKLKAIFEETLGCVFNELKPINDKHFNDACVQSYDSFRKDLSRQKNASPLDANRFFHVLPEGKDNKAHPERDKRDEYQNACPR